MARYSRSWPVTRYVHVLEATFISGQLAQNNLDLDPPNLMLGELINELTDLQRPLKALKKT